MHVMVNGKKETISDLTTVKEFLSLKNLDPKKVVVELNMNIVNRETFDAVMLKENDSLEVMRFVGGG